MSRNMDSMAKKPQKCHKISCIFVCTFCLISITNIATPPHFSIFLLEILKSASKLNLAAILLIGFLNFEFGAILAPF